MPLRTLVLRVRISNFKEGRGGKWNGFSQGESNMVKQVSDRKAFQIAKIACDAVFKSVYVAKA
jgi:hypothetical protein